MVGGEDFEDAMLLASHAKDAANEGGWGLDDRAIVGDEIGDDALQVGLHAHKLGWGSDSGVSGRRIVTGEGACDGRARLARADAASQGEQLISLHRLSRRDAETA